MSFAWDERLALHVPVIDEEHRSLFALANRLHEAFAAREAAQRLGDILFELLRYTRVHFAHEEQLMERHGYPRLAGHRRQHREFTDRVQDFHGRYTAGEVDLGVAVLPFLEEWLRRHVAGSDLQLGAWLCSQGVAEAGGSQPRTGDAG